MKFSQYTTVIKYGENLTSHISFRKCSPLRSSFSEKPEGKIFSTPKTKDEGGTVQVLKDFAWNTFEFTGNIDSYFFFKEIEERNNGAAQKEIAEEEAAISKGR